MSFFGFDATLPRAQGHRGDTPGFFQPPDPFAGISRPAEDGEDDGDDAVDFEDTYDGLGDQLDDADDVLNDDTFGADGAEPATQAAIGRDFDFFGQTAKVSDAINEEHLRYNRHVPPVKFPTASDIDTARVASKPIRTGYEKYKDAGSIPDLQANPSLWGVAPKRSANDAGQPMQEPRPAENATAAPARKMMSLAEVEAAMLAQNKKPLPVRPQPVQATSSQPSLYEAQVQPDQTIASSAGQSSQHNIRQITPGEPRYAQPTPFKAPLAAVSHQQPSFRSPEPQPSNRSSQIQPVQPRQILQNPDRHPAQINLAYVVALPEQKQLPASQSQAPPRGPMHQLPMGAFPQSLMHLSEGDRARLLHEEAKRAKRNHKIYLLSRDNGLMTPQDKNFITRIQLQQLVTATGNPNEQGTDAALVEDFYYQVHSQIRGGPRQNPHQPLNHFAQTYLFQTGVRQGGAAGRRLHRGGDNHIQRMEQQVQRAVEAAKLKPKNKQLVIEGSLGKISFSNAKTPKPLLNVKRSESSQDANRPQSRGRSAIDRKPQHDDTYAGNRRNILRQIEEVYTLLMQMEDHERHLPPQPTSESDSSVVQQHMEWTQAMQVLNNKLWKGLQVMEPIVANSPAPHPFIAFLSFAKGKKAIPRIFRQIDQQQRVTILTLVVVHVGVLDVVRLAQLQPSERQLPTAVREEVELFSQAVMPSLFGYVNEAPLHIVIGLLGILLDSADVQVVARAKIGLAMLTMFLSRAEIVKQAGEVSDEDWSHWTVLYGRLFDSLEPVLGLIFPGSVNSGEDVYVWQFLAAVGLGANPEQQQRLVMAVKDRVMETVSLSKTLPAEMSSRRLGNVNLFMRAIGLDVELLG